MKYTDHEKDKKNKPHVHRGYHVPQ